MKLGFIADTIESDFKFAADNKTPYLEFIPWIPWADFIAKRRDMETWLDKYHCKPSAMGFFNRDIIHPDEAKRNAELTDARNMINLCRDWNCPVFMIGGGELQKGRDERDALKHTIETLRRLLDYAGERNVQLAVYNCHCWNYCVAPRHWEALLNALPNIRFKYDSSHAYYDNRDYLSEIRDFAKYFAHFHVKGCIKAEGVRVDDPPAGLDQIDWRSIMALLYSRHYQGVLSLEPHSPPWTDPKELKYQGLAFGTRFIRSLMVE